MFPIVHATAHEGVAHHAQVQFVFLNIFGAVGLLLAQGIALEIVHLAVIADDLAFGNHLTSFPNERNLVHADFHHVHFEPARIHVIEARLENVGTDSFFADLRKLPFRRLAARERGDHADIPDGNADGIDDFHLVAHGVQPVAARSERLPPDAFLPGTGEEFGGWQIRPDLGGHNPDFARRHKNRTTNFVIVRNRIQEMPAFRKHVFLHAALPFFGENLSRRQRRAVLGGNDCDLTGADIKPAETPLPELPSSEAHRHHGGQR